MDLQMLRSITTQKQRGNFSSNPRCQWKSARIGTRVGAVNAAKPTHYKLLLCWGGPAVQIVGTLDDYNQPDSAELQHQDWFTEWTPFPISAEMEATLIAYAAEFYFDQ
jgi:hypothetical protein